MVAVTNLPHPICCRGSTSALSAVTGANVVRTAIFTIDRAGMALRADLAETISNHLGNEEIVQVGDSRKPPGRQLRYTIQ